MKNKFINLTLLAGIVVFFNACSLTIGANEGYCEDCGYKADGYCGNPIDIYNNKDLINKLYEKGIHNKDMEEYIEEKKYDKKKEKREEF
jgi:predicted amidophosphoribosyltransferase